MTLVYFSRLALISSKEISSAGWIILLLVPVLVIKGTLSPLGVDDTDAWFVVGGALMVAPVKDEAEGGPPPKHN